MAIVGPTGAGKTELSLRIAEHLDGEIVNCDSMQIYRGFDIGTAKLALDERRGIPHHLIDIADPLQPFSAGDYARAARIAANEIAERSRAPIVAGGTGFYLRALLDGLPDLPQQNAPLRERLSQRSSESLHRLLKRLDPSASLRLHAQDRMRVIRSLEIRLLTGVPTPPLMPGSAMPGFHVRKIALIPPREELYRTLDQRTDRMFRDGLVDEVEHLLASGVPGAAKPFEAVGYRQALAVVQGRSTVAEAVEDTRRATRQYAKRQMTWFRHDTGVEILPAFGSEIRSVDGLLTEKKRIVPLTSSNTL